MMPNLIVVLITYLQRDLTADDYRMLYPFWYV